MSAKKMLGNSAVRALLLGGLLVGAGLWGGHWWTTGRWLESTDNAYVRGDITSITPKVAGEIVEVLVRDNQLVKRGELLIRIDPRDYEARLANARANVAVAEAALVANDRNHDMQQAMIAESRAQLAAAQADRRKQNKDFQRADSLVKDGVATVARLDIATAGLQSAEANVARGEAGLKATRTQVGMLDADRGRLQAQLQAAQAAVRLAELDLEATAIHSPVDGLVGDLSARLGERVNGGLRLMSLVSAGPVWIEANFKETQLTRVLVGQKAEVRIDAFPDARLQASVQSLSPASGAEFALLPPDNATGNFTKIVQRVPVKLALELTPELREKLRPGMSVEATINTKPGA